MFVALIINECMRRCRSCKRFLEEGKRKERERGAKDEGFIILSRGSYSDAAPRIAGQGGSR